MATVKGVAPGFLLLPAREYTWELIRKVQISIPIEGKISETLNDVELASGVKIAGEDDFCIFEEDTFYLWEIVRVLFAKVSYPQLKDDECLNVVALERTGNDLIIYGEIIKSAG